MSYKSGSVILTSYILHPTSEIRHPENIHYNIDQRTLTHIRYYKTRIVYLLLSNFCNKIHFYMNSCR